MNFPCTYLIILSSLKNLVGIYRDDDDNEDDVNNASAKNKSSLS